MKIYFALATVFCCVPLISLGLALIVVGLIK